MGIATLQQQAGLHGQQGLLWQPKDHVLGHRSALSRGLSLQATALSLLVK
jgi:hypothetical protein